jgi:hypothetical protein
MGKLWHKALEEAINLANLPWRGRFARLIKTGFA